MKIIFRMIKWFEDRTGIIAAIKPVAEHPVPKKAGWYYVFGSATLVAFLIQVFTGTLLSLSYIPSTSEAYQTLQFITSQAWFGRVLRGMHFFGASAMILLMGIHIIRTFLMAAYKFPREVSWMSGVLLMGLTLGMGFTGQLLRWDQNAIWSVVVGTEQAARVPFIGHPLAHFILGGEFLGGATLSRFYSAHVFFLPGIMYLLIALHLFLVIRNGISEPPIRGKKVDPDLYQKEYEEMLKTEGTPFFPNSAWRDILFGACVVIVIVGLAVIFGPPILGQPPNPTIIAAQPRPDWYLLWYFALLALLPHGAENFVMVFVPLIFGCVLLFFPLFAGRGERHPAKRPWAILIVIAVVTTIGAFTVAGYQENWSPDFAAKPLSDTVIASSNPQVNLGAKLFYSKACLNCHQISGFGGKRGPDLSLVARRLTPDQITIRIMNGGYNMPPYGTMLNPSEVSSIVSFLNTRK
jgi:ubiquinol-cytochrome c reductase cytochrome b subunit